MPADAAARMRKHLKEFNFKALFIEELGWDHHTAALDISFEGKNFTLTARAQKRGMVIFTCTALKDGNIPDYALRRKIEQQVAKSVHEHIIIYTDAAKTHQVWQWIKREAGKPAACREHHYYSEHTGEALLQKLEGLAISLKEEETVSLVDVTGRARAAFDVERVTKKFYERFKTEHAAFLKFLKGIPDEEHQRWHASIMLNRLMFIYFIQKKSFLDDDTDYLRNKLAQSKECGKDKFYKDFLRVLFFEGFATTESERSDTVKKLLGKVPYLNGGIFMPHDIEQKYGKDIHIPDSAFDNLFEFFEQYQWHLDERPRRADNEINPDVLGYIFEKYINQKQMGAYYTKEDITGYISKNTVIPFLFDAAQKKCKIAFEGKQSIWTLLQADPDRYIYDAVKKGVGLPLHDEIAAGLKDVSKRTQWNKHAPQEYALPTEIWREVVARRKRYEEVRAKLKSGEIKSINDFITYNLDIRQFAQDVIYNCEGPELLRAFWHAIVGRIPEKSNEKFEYGITILDPTCGSGAFLFAALNMLEPLYEACLDRMQVFIDEMEQPACASHADRSGKKHRPEKFSDFKNILEEVKKHPSPRYFIFKSIIVNNLYGVDIMDEAVEICKLRLFLKLVAQVEDVSRLEPLPDIDFNIRAGNTLVGFATKDEVKEAITITKGKHEQINLLFGDAADTLNRIDENAEIADRAFKKFQEMQTKHGMDSKSFSNAKNNLRERLKALEDELNTYLAAQYGVDIKKKSAYQKWLSSHKPFHWFIDFYGIMKHGGFDVIIGNPPYVEYSKVRDEYTIKNYKTETCGNLYAFVMERSMGIVRTKGYFGMIVPISLVCSERMSTIREDILGQCLSTWFSNFAIRPQPLFAEIMQRNTVNIAQVGKNQPCRIFSTNYLRWTAVEREYLFRRFCFADVTNYVADGEVIPKVSKSVETGALVNIKNNALTHIVNLKNPPLETLYFHDSGESYWTKTLWDKPHAYRNNRPVEPSQWFDIQIPAKEKTFVYLLLNSNLFYWLWTVFTDCRHMTKGFIESLALPIKHIVDNHELRERLKEAYSENTVLFEKRPGYKSPEIKVQNFKPIIDDIDRVLAKHYGFTDEELDFIINYDIKYRMGRDAIEEEEK